MRASLAGLLVACLARSGLAGAVVPQPAGYQALALTEPQQDQPPLEAADPILLPRSGAPALVGWGDELPVLVQVSGAQGAASDATAWSARLCTRTRAWHEQEVGAPLRLCYDLAFQSIRAIASNRMELRVVVPAVAPRDVYHLEVDGPGLVRGRAVYAVRVLGPPLPQVAGETALRFAVLGDPQLRDPSSRLEGADASRGRYPKTGQSDAESIFVQQAAELAFWDPDFVINVGDLVFGVDYRAEVLHTLRLWWSQPLATFVVPGNHDGLALYTLAFKDDWWVTAIKSVRCAKYVVRGEVDAAAVFSLLACLYGDLKQMLFEHLSQDGLSYFRRLLGPTDYSFDLGALHLVGLNSYSGTPERRHAFALALDALGIDLGVATVDNYGGTVEPAQLRWLEADLSEATAAGKTVVMFLHHDPRGNLAQPWGSRYHPNLPFPTEPLGLRAFQEWNYEGPDWDSDPGDSARNESQRRNSATALLELIGRHASWVLTGHLHGDHEDAIAPGAELSPGSAIVSSRPVHFLRVTTAGSTTERDSDHWGYRLFSARGGQIEATALGFAGRSVPAGKLWLSGTGVPSLVLAGSRAPSADGADRLGRLLYVVHSELPEPVTGRLRAFLPDALSGYRFSADGGTVRLTDVGVPAGGANIYYLEVSLPAAAGSPSAPDVAVALSAAPANGNQVPQVWLRCAEEGVVEGSTVRCDGSQTKDDGTVIQLLWDFGDGATARGEIVSHVFIRAGDYVVSLTAIDDCGARARFSTTLSVAAVASCSVGGPACVAGSVLLVLLTIGVLYFLRTRRCHPRQME